MTKGGEFINSTITLKINAHTFSTFITNATVLAKADGRI